MEREIKRTDPFYNTPRWKHLRECIMRRDGYQCQDARRYGKMIPAEVVHHIFPREIFPEYQWAEWNLISISNKAHEAMHYRSTKELTDKGKELLIRTARKQGIDLDQVEKRLSEYREIMKSSAGLA